MNIKEFWHINQYESEIREKNYPEAGPDKLLIKSMYSLLSTGTERIVANGLVPGEIKELMKVPFMEGSFDFPVKYGYSLVGKVLQGSQSWIGKIVHIMHPHQDYAIVPDTKITLVPEPIPPQRAVLASNMETAVNAIWESGISLGDRIIICGFGIIGALIALIAKQIPSVNIFVHETDPDRKKIAASMGFSIFDTGMRYPEKFDLAFNTSASAEALQLCIDTTLSESKIIELSWYGKNPVNIMLGAAFHIGHKQIIASQVSDIPLIKQGHYSHKRRKQIVFDLLQNSVFDQLPFQLDAFSELPIIFDQIRKKEYRQFATIIKY